MARKWLPPACDGYKRIRPPAYFTGRGYYMEPGSTWLKKGKVVIHCHSRSCAVYRMRRDRSYTAGYSAGSLSAACASPTNHESYGGIRRRRRRARR